MVLYDENITYTILLVLIDFQRGEEHPQTLSIEGDQDQLSFQPGAPLGFPAKVCSRKRDPQRINPQKRELLEEEDFNGKLGNLYEN